MVHGCIIRSKNGGQFAMLILLSGERGKGQGKSGSGAQAAHKKTAVLTALGGYNFYNTES